MAVSPDGLHVSVAAGGYDTVTWLDRDSTSGALTYVDRYSNPNIDAARSVAISPDGKNVYVTAYLGDAVAWFRRD